MKKIKRWFSDIFNPQEFNDLNMESIGEALNDSTVRTIWLADVLSHIKQMNLDVDRRLLSGTEMGLTDLCARRKAYQDVLVAVLSAKRQATQEVRHNPRIQVPVVNLDRVTV